MEGIAIPLAKAVVLVPVTLLPIINPLTTAPVFVATLGGNRTAAKALARQVALQRPRDHAHAAVTHAVEQAHRLGGGARIVDVDARPRWLRC